MTPMTKQRKTTTISNHYTVDVKKYLDRPSAHHRSPLKRFERREAQSTAEHEPPVALLQHCLRRCCGQSFKHPLPLCVVLRPKLMVFTPARNNFEMFLALQTDPCSLQPLALLALRLLGLLRHGPQKTKTTERRCPSRSSKACCLQSTRV